MRPKTSTSPRSAPSQRSGVRPGTSPAGSRTDLNPRSPQGRGAPRSTGPSRGNRGRGTGAGQGRLPKAGTLQADDDSFEQKSEQGPRRIRSADPLQTQENTGGDSSSPTTAWRKVESRLSVTCESRNSIAASEIWDPGHQCSSEGTGPSSAEVIATLSADEIAARLSALQEMLGPECHTSGVSLEDCLVVALDLGFELVERNKKREVEINRLARDVEELRTNMEALPAVQTTCAPLVEIPSTTRVSVMAKAQEELCNQNFVHLMTDTMRFLQAMIERAEVAEATARMLESMLEVEEGARVRAQARSCSPPLDVASREIKMTTRVNPVVLPASDSLSRSVKLPVQGMAQLQSGPAALMCGVRQQLTAQNTPRWSSGGPLAEPQASTIARVAVIQPQQAQIRPPSQQARMALAMQQQLPFSNSTTPQDSGRPGSPRSPSPWHNRSVVPQGTLACSGSTNSPFWNALMNRPQTASFTKLPSGGQFASAYASPGMRSASPSLQRSLSSGPTARYRTASPHQQGEAISVGPSCTFTPDRPPMRRTSTGMPPALLPSAIPVTRSWLEEYRQRQAFAAGTLASTSAGNLSRTVTASPNLGPQKMFSPAMGLFDMLDRNHDGVITRAEWEAAVAAQCPVSQDG